MKHIKISDANSSFDVADTSDSVADQHDVHSPTALTTSEASAPSLESETHSDSMDIDVLSNVLVKQQHTKSQQGAILVPAFKNPLQVLT